MAFNWRKRINKQDDVMAEDVNELAAEIMRMSTAIEVIEQATGDRDDLQIQAAIDRLALLGSGTVFIKPGKYDTWKAIFPKSNVNIVMTRATVIRKHNQHCSWLTEDFKVGDNKFYVEDISGFCVGQDIGIVKNSVPYPDSFRYEYGTVSRIIGIEANALILDPAFDHFLTSDYLASEQCVVFSHFSGIYGEEASNVYIVGGELDGNKENVKHLVVNADADENGIPSAACANFRIHNVVVHGFRFQGIHPWGYHYGYEVCNCEVYANDAGGIVLDTIGNMIVRNNYCHDHGGVGLMAVDCVDASIQGGRYWNNGTGIALVHSNERFRISDVDCRNNSDYGISFYGTQYSWIEGAVCIDNAKVGILFDGTSIYNSVNNATIRNSNVGIAENGAADFNRIGIVNYLNCVTEHNPVGANTNIADIWAHPKYFDIPSSSGSLELPSGINDSIINISVEGQSVYNILGDSGDISKHIGTYVDGVCQAGTDAYHVYLEAGHRQTSGFYSGMVVVIIAGQGSGTDPRRCFSIATGYDSTANYCGFSDRFADAPAEGSTYRVYYKDSYQLAGWHGNVYAWSSNLMKQLPGGKWGLDACFSDLDVQSGFWRADSCRFYAKEGRKYIVLAKFHVSDEGDSTIGIVDSDNHVMVTSSSHMCRLDEWTTVLATFTGGNFNAVGIFWGSGGYPYRWDKCFVADIMVLDLSATGDDGLSDTQLYAKYATYSYFTNTPGQASVPGRILMYKDIFLKNLMGDYGDITLHAAEYAAGGKFNTLWVWFNICLKTIDGFKCLDCYFSDYWWPNAPRCNAIMFKTQPGHKYVVRALIKKTIAFDEVDPMDGSTISQQIYSNEDWAVNCFITIAKASDIFICLRSGYVTFDMGYIRDIMVFDATYLGDGDLTDIELSSKYGAYPFFNNIKIDKDAAYYEIPIPELYAIGAVKDRISSSGILERKIMTSLIQSSDNFVDYPLMTTGTTVSTGFTLINSGLTLTTQVSTTDGQVFSVTNATANGSYAMVYTDMLDIPVLSTISLGTLVKLENSVNLAIALRLEFYNASNVLLSATESLGNGAAVFDGLYLNGKSVPTAATKVRLIAKVTALAAGASGTASFKSAACCLGKQLEIYEKNTEQHMNYEAIVSESIDLGSRLVGIGAPGDPIFFERSLKEFKYYNTGITPDVRPIATVDRVFKVDATMEMIEIDKSLATVAADKQSFVIAGSVADDLICYIYTHGIEGHTPSIICTGAVNVKAQTWMTAKSSVDAQFNNTIYQTIMARKIDKLEQEIADIKARI